jgi:hypothetical protein
VECRTPGRPTPPALSKLRQAGCGGKTYWSWRRRFRSAGGKPPGLNLRTPSGQTRKANVHHPPSGTEQNLLKRGSTMKTTLFSRITLTGLLLSAAVASNAAMAQGTAAPAAKPVAHQAVQHKTHKALHKTAHKAKHHKKAQSKTAAPTAPAAASPAPVQAPAPTK